MNKQILILNEGIKHISDLAFQVSANEHRLGNELRDKKKELLKSAE